MSRVPNLVLIRMFFRSFLLQAAWNYRTLQGSGLAWVLLPLLRHLHGRGEALDRAVERHAGPFNAHPYLAALALGSLSRLETEGSSAEMIRRFRTALGGPLGALGDRLVWAAWLPLCAVVAVCLYWAGLSPGWVLVVFLATYNAGHLFLRIWGFREGWEAGSDLAVRIRTMGLSALASRVEGWLAGALGVLVGLTIVAPALQEELALPWAFGGLGVLVVGIVLGPRVWRPTAVATVAGVGLILVAGFFI